jgi:hypothetical protein
MLLDALFWWPSTQSILSAASGFDICRIGGGEFGGNVADESMGGDKRLKVVWKHAIVAVFLSNLWDGLNCENVYGDT